MNIGVFSRRRLMGFVYVALITLASAAAAAQTTSFTYQGKLIDSGSPANGSYDLQFTLWDSVSNGAQIGSTQTLSAVAVSNGVFTVTLDFGGNAFNGANRFLEIGARTAGSGSFTILTPRQQITSTPYAIRALNAGSADALSSACVACVQDSQINSVSGNKVNGAIAVASLPAGSTNYIQNSTSPQPGSNFNISGNGTIGGNLTTNGTVGIGTAAGSSLLTVAKVSTAGPGVIATVSGNNAISGTNTQFTANFRVGDQIAAAGLPAGTTVINVISDTAMALSAAATATASNVTYTIIGGPRFVVQGVGNVGIDTVNPASALHVRGTGWFQGDNTPLTGGGAGVAVGMTTFETGYVFAFDYGGTGAKTLLLNSPGGNVGVGPTTNPQRQLDVAGRARVESIPLEASFSSVCFNAAGDLLQCGASSLRWKTNVHPFFGGLDVVRRLNPISFNWKEGGEKDIGLAAEDVAKVAPALSLINNKGEAEGVKYERLNILLINAVKQQQEQIEALQRTNASLTTRLNAVEKRLRNRSSRRRMP